MFCCQPSLSLMWDLNPQNPEVHSLNLGLFEEGIGSSQEHRTLACSYPPWIFLLGQNPHCPERLFCCGRETSFTPYPLPSHQARAYSKEFFSDFPLFQSRKTLWDYFRKTWLPRLCFCLRCTTSNLNLNVSNDTFILTCACSPHKT